MTPTRVRIGLVGFGLFGRHHAAKIDAGASTRLVAIATKSESSRTMAQECFPAAIVMADFRELVERSDIDAIDIVVPNDMHFEVCHAALVANKHVLLEKPMGINNGQCDALWKFARRQKRILAIGHELRLSALWGQVKDLIDEGRIGEPLHALVELSRFPYRPGSEGWRYREDRVGNWILEEPIHFFDLIRWYLASRGEPLSVYARGNSRDSEHPQLHDNFSAIVNFTGGAYAVVTQTLAAFGHHQTAKVTGTRGCIWASWSASDARSDTAKFALKHGLGNDVQEVSLPAMTGELVELGLQLEAFAKAIQTGAAPPCTGEDGRWSTRLCLAALESIQRGVVVGLDGPSS